MRRTHIASVGFLALAAVVAACSDASQDPTAAVPRDGDGLVRLAMNAQPEQVMPGEVLVRVRPGAEVSAVARGHGLALQRMGHGNAFAVLRGAVGNERALAARLKGDERVAWAEPNYLRQPSAVDPRLWAFFNPGGLSVAFTKGKNGGNPVTNYYSTADADEDVIEGIGAGGAAVVVGSIDTGVDMDHPDFLPGQLIAGYDWYNNDNNPADDDDHGTHTSGTMAGTTVGIAGVTGAAPNVQVHVQKVCGRRGCPVSAIADAIRAAADVPNMVAMNLSIGGTSLSNAEASAIDYAKSRDVLVIAAAGNGGTGTVDCPACDPDAISVAATTWQDGLTYYSNWGPGLDISAAGGELYSNTTDEAGIFSAVRNGYGYMQGTSMATPQVTGAAGVVASVTGLRGAALRTRLESSADDIGASGYDQTFGNGRLNVYRAITGGTLGSGL